MFNNNNRKLNLNLESCTLLLVFIFGGFLIFFAYSLIAAVISAVIASVIYIRLGRGKTYFSNLGKLSLTMIILVGFVLMVLFSTYPPEVQIMSKPLSIILAIVFLTLFIVGPIKRNWFKNDGAVSYINKWCNARFYPDFFPDWITTPAMRALKEIHYDEMIQIVRKMIN